MPNYIFTTHAKERSALRDIPESYLAQTLQAPQKKQAQAFNRYKFTRVIDGRKVQVIATWKPHAEKWLIISAWVRGEIDQAPLAWRIISFPFWLGWKLLVWTGNWIYHRLR